MNRRVEIYFPKVLEATKEVFKNEVTKKGIPSVYKGYVSSFGTMVVQNGILPALAFYEKKDAKGDGDRKKLVDIIKRILADEGVISTDRSEFLLVEEIIKECREEKQFNREKLRNIEGRIIDISIAMKLSLRTFLEDETSYKED